MSELSHLKPAKGAVKKKKRIGRGESSGWGKTAGSGHKGQKARSGNSKPRRGFEGGQMPLARRLPKRGFTSQNRVEYAIVNVGQLEVFGADAVIDLDTLRARGMVKKGLSLLKILANGDLNISLTVKAHKFSQAAINKITSAGGSIELIEG
ncbi:50S ribosomal protein L15 [Myxococcota bacterium]|nr:50S ribosomal protein L15 [Myxococcota bacterium]MBU1430955.1 50S ribosomal protein L15 [Myxococcota bacterium]MBU1897250.1 50S ribosomal protein L15 [Myxococcota bacterium]